MNAPRRPRRRVQEPVTPPTQLIQLGVSLAILLIAFCLKLAFPERTEAIMKKYIGTGIDLQQSVSAIGAGLRDVFSPIRPQKSPELSASVTSVPSPTPSVMPSAPAAPAPTPEPQDSDVPAATSEAQMLTMDEQLFESAARAVVALSTGEWLTDPEEDDTPPVPFGVTVPEKADYSRHELPFEYTAPIPGALTSGFGFRVHPIDQVTKFHYGLDIQGASGTTVGCFADGRVMAAGKHSSYGNYVLVEHADGYSTLYAHLSKISVKKNAKVKMGATIGKVGMTGKATGPHLHFELRKDGKMLDPTPFVGL